MVVLVVVLMGVGSARAAWLVREGKPAAVIVLQDEAAAVQADAIEELQWHLEQATGVRLPTAAAGELTADDPRLRVYFGPGQQVAALGLDGRTLEPEAARVWCDGQRLVFLGYVDEQGRSGATLWAVDDFLDRVMGVRWLWPGEVGTVVPERASVQVQAMDWTHRPAQGSRRLRNLLYKRTAEGVGELLSDAAYEKVNAEAETWLRRQKMGERDGLPHGHAFGNWWAKYHQAHPEYFAKAPTEWDGPYPYPNQRRVKLCVSEPGVVERVLEEWRAAGRPAMWNVCPNDGSGFCTCDRCMALDAAMEGASADQQPMDVWRARGDVTGRYLAFWKELGGRMQAERADARLVSYVYSSYKTPPADGWRFASDMTLVWVDSFVAQDSWQRWRDAGASLFLRPNWWHTGAVVPHMLPRKMGGFFKFAQQNEMVGFDFDSLTGHWGTQGVNYYVVARLAARDDLTVEQAIAEWVDGFGPASEAVARYLRYWEDYSRRVAFAVPVGGGEPWRKGGLYARTLKAKGVTSYPLVGSWRTMAWLYGEDVMRPAEEILRQAMAAAEQAGDATAAARVRFLMDGLAHVRMTRDVVAMGYADTRPRGATAVDYRAKAEQLQRLRAELTVRHVVWGESLNFVEGRWGVPTWPGRRPWRDGEGM